ncbi:Protein FAM170A [Vulpes lagopus]
MKILKKQKDTTQPGESTSQEENNAVVSSDLPCASDNQNTEILKKQKDTTQPGESTSQEENNAVVSSDLPCASDNQNTEVLNTDEDIVLPGPSGLAQGHSQRAEVSDSEYISCIASADKLFDREFSKKQENVPQPESVVSSGSEIAGAKTSSSEYVCISPSGSHQKHQDVSHPGQSEQHETSSPFPYVSFPFHLVSSTKPSEPSVQPQKERLMKIYYMHVQMKRGVAVLSDPEEEQEPPSKKARLEEMAFPEKVHTDVTPSHVCTKELLTGSESSWNSEAQEEKEEADSPAETPAVEECPRAKTPEWLVALDSGFRCMGCCRVFPSLEALQEHVQHGVTEGFSCHKFHLALAWLKSKKNRAKKRRGENTRKRTHRGQKEHHSGMNIKPDSTKGLSLSSLNNPSTTSIYTHLPPRHYQCTSQQQEQRTPFHSTHCSPKKEGEEGGSHHAEQQDTHMQSKSIVHQRILSTTTLKKGDALEAGTVGGHMVKEEW